MRNRRFLIALLIAIPVFWLVMMGLLLRREAFIPRLDPGQAAGAAYSDVPTDVWVGVFLTGRAQIGYVNVRTRPEPRGEDPGTTITILGRVRLTMMETPAEMIFSGQTWISREAGMRDFKVTVRSGDHDLRVSGTVDGGNLIARVETAGETYPVSFPVGNSLSLNSGMGFNTMYMPALEPGDEFLIDTFDPLTLSVGQARIQCTGRETITVEGRAVEASVVSTIVSGIKTRAWVSENGEVLRAETPMGFVIERIRQEDAIRFMNEQQDIDSFATLAAVHTTGSTPFRGARRMVVRFTGIDADLQVPTDDTQVAAPDGSYIIEIPQDQSQEGHQPASDDIGREYLKNDPFVQSAAPRIKETAQAIVGDAADNWQRAMKLYEWVYASIDKTAVLSVPSALDVLETRQGDCNEHAVLYTALARASGVPTRIALGLVWSEYYHAFYYHAWPEVYVGRWIWVDPTLGQPFADATHIKLLTGGIESWWQLVPFLGNIRIHVDAIE